MTAAGTSQQVFFRRGGQCERACIWHLASTSAEASSYSCSSYSSLSSPSASSQPSRKPHGVSLQRLLTGDWVVARTSAKQRRMVHYWLTILWLTVGTVLWLV